MCQVNSKKERISRKDVVGRKGCNGKNVKECIRRRRNSEEGKTGSKKGACVTFSMWGRLSLRSSQSNVNPQRPE